MLLLLATTAQAGFLGGVAWVPAGIGALSFSESGGFSGTLSSEWDGWMRPPLTASAGWVGGQTALLGNVAVVEIISESASDEVHTFNVGGIRLGGDWRHYLWARTPGKVNVWGTAGVFGIVPNSAEADSGWTVAEQQESDKDSSDRRAQIGGLGAQGGVAAEYLFADGEGTPAVALGARWVVRGFGGLDVEETQTDFSMLISTEAALFIEFTR
ncbi:hypothetical protein LBMAG42_00940 [Deltaproteobacteria bacterium]|nr:hypothetical protein LBMAG42_00940 [Deltaproteobacteria bacterium]